MKSVSHSVLFPGAGLAGSEAAKQLAQSRMARKLDLSETAGDNPWRRRQ